MPSQALHTDGLPEPPEGAPATERLAWLLAVQARACGVMGSPLYAALLTAAADDARGGGPVAELLVGEVGEGRSRALALRFMAAVHRVVLAREAPALALHYPSVGGTAAADGAWPALRELLVQRQEDLSELVRRPCQTNEVGRCAALMWGWLEVARTTGLPLRLLEVGASAGLNLRADRFRYGTAGRPSLGPADSPVDLVGLWAEPPPAGVGAGLEVAARRGCDPAPIDPTSAEGRLSLSSSVWADQTARFARLRGAMAVAGQVPAAVDTASVARWLPEQLADPAPGVATVVFHSVVEEYLSGAERAALHDEVDAAGERASPDAPLAWLRLEPISALRHHGVTLKQWPGGAERVLAICGAHGSEVRRPSLG